MRKKLDTRFPAAKIKKIMQADEDVGKIAMAVPLLVSKALELFLQDLCDRTYDITLKKGAKTLNSLHLKQCVHNVNVFDFLKEVVRNVPDLGNSDAAVDDPNIAKRRKAADADEDDSDKDLNRGRTETSHTTSRGRGRGRPRGRPRGARVAERQISTSHSNLDDDTSSDRCNYHQGDGNDHEHQKENIPAGRTIETRVQDFDLNMDLDENGELMTTSTITSVAPPAKPTREMKHENLRGWSFADVEKMDIDPTGLANLIRKVDDEDEDYDEEV